MKALKKSKEDSFRQRAKRLLLSKKGTTRKIPADDLKKLIHEFEVHQVELEIQNEELRRAQEEIEKSRVKYVDLYDFAPVGNFTFTPDGKIVETNLTGAALLGIERQRLLGTVFSLFVAMEFRSVFRRHCSEVLKKEHRERCELKLMKKDGTFFYAELESIGVDGNDRKAARIRSAVLDITKRKQAEEELNRRTQEHERLTENAPDVIFRLDRHLRFVFVNRKISDFTAVPKEKFCGKTLLDAGLPRDVCIHLGRKAQEVFRLQTLSEFEFNFSGPGGVRWFHARIVPEFDIHGNIGTVLGIAHEVTEQKTKNEEIQKVNRELEQRFIERTAKLDASNKKLQDLNQVLRRRTAEIEDVNKELEAFTYSVSHDLKAPLIVASGFCRRLSERYGQDLDDKGRHYLQRMQEACHQMILLIEDLLKLSKMTVNPAEFKPVNISMLAKSIVAQLKEKQPDRNVTFSIEEGLTVKSDSRLLKIALENLLVNAWKYTTFCEQAIIEVGSLKPAGEGTVFFVRDNGCGFDMSMSDRLFKPFQRLHGNEEFSGTGIGLATVHRIIQRHGGRIWAESEINRGSTFFFALSS